MPDMNVEAMLEEIAQQYPQIEAKAMDLKDDIMDLMGDEELEEAPMEEELSADDVELDLDEDEEELELEL
jgi:hypothetical protein